MTTYIYKLRKLGMGLLLLLFFLGTKAQTDLTPDYDIGVFYMPLWHNLNRTPYSGQQSHHWYHVEKYNQWLIDNGKSYKIRKPSSYYYQSGSGDARGPSSFYNENLKKVTEKQLSLMADHGIDFVIYNSYWERVPNKSTFRAYWQGVINNWLPDNGPNSVHNWDPSPNPLNTHGVKMAIKWTTHFTHKYINNATAADCRLFYKPGGGLDQMIDYWAQYMKLDDYKTTSDGRPMFYVSHAHTIANIVSECRNDEFFDNAEVDPNPSTWIPFNETKVLLNHMNNRFKQKANLSKDVYFVAVVNGAGEWHDKWDWMLRWPDEGGFDASTTLRYDAWTTGDENHLQWPVQNNRQLSTSQRYSHDKMTSIYGNYNNYVLNNSYSTYPNTRVDYQVPVSAGWDASPIKYKNDCWNKPGANLATCGNPEWDYKGSTFDDRESTPSSFGRALQVAKDYADQYPNRTKKTIVMYAWNEHTEGTVIEPTTRWGQKYIDLILGTFHTSTGGGGVIPTPFRPASSEVFDVESNEILILQSIDNPSSIDLKLAFLTDTELEVQVLDLQGKLLQQETFKELKRGRSSIQFDLNFEAQGLYIVRAISSELVETKKVLID